jgi:bacteriorhodopsin
VQDVSKLASIRYYDWIITTPLMLLSMIVYMKYLESTSTQSDSTQSDSTQSDSTQSDSTQSDSPVRLTEFIKTHRCDIARIFGFNLLMLYFGYLGETNAIDKWTSTLFGFFFFALAWNKVYSFASKTDIGKNVYFPLLVIWSIYGIAALADDTTKNNVFNVLDLFSKNFFALFLYHQVLRVNAKTRSNFTQMP